MSRQTLLLILLSSLSLCFSQTERTYRVYDYPPHYYYEDGWKGLSIDLINLLLKEAGYSYKQVKLPFTRGLIQLKNGELDVMTNLSPKKEREEFLYFIGPQMYETMSLFFPEDSEYIINSLDDIKKLPGKIGIHLGYFYGPEFDTKYKSDKEFADKFYTLKNSNDFNAFVRKGRIIGYIGERFDFYYNSTIDPGYKGMKEHSFVINDAPVYFGFSKETFTQEDIEHIKTVFESEKVQDRMTEILNRYLLVTQQER